MRLTTCLLTSLLFLSTKLSAQNNQCNCLENVNKLVSKTEENYAGFPIKVNSNTQSTYKDLIKSIEKRASKETNPKACFFLLKEYIRFFKDKHFTLRYINPDDFDKEIAVYSKKYFQEQMKKKRATKY